MADDMTLRTCGRTSCRWPAAASLSFRYATGQVWLADLSPEPDPALYDLCPHHADTLTVPRGWQRVDERTERAVVSEPAGRDLDPEQGGRAPGAGGYGGNRYAALTASLPRLAREFEAATPGDREVVRAAVPSRDLAPMPTDAVPMPGHGGSGGHSGAEPAHVGAGAPPAGEAVVVPFDGGTRRRS